MTNREKAKVILEYLDKNINVNWVFEEFYIEAIIKGLKEIENKKPKAATLD